MASETANVDSTDSLVAGLLQKVAKDRAASLRYNTRSLVVIYSILVVVVLLGLVGANIALVASFAIAGLAGFWYITWRQGKKLEKQLYQEEERYYKDLMASRPENNNGESQTVAPGDIPLSQRELEILTLIAQGNMNKEIARILGLSTHTVRNYTVRILRRLEVDDRTSAAVVAISRGWIKKETLAQMGASPQTKKDSPTE